MEGRQTNSGAAPSVSPAGKPRIVIDPEGHEPSSLVEGSPISMNKIKFEADQNAMGADMDMSDVTPHSQYQQPSHSNLLGEEGGDMADGSQFHTDFQGDFVQSPDFMMDK